MLTAPVVLEDYEETLAVASSVIKDRASSLTGKDLGKALAIKRDAHSSPDNQSAQFVSTASFAENVAPRRLQDYVPRAFFEPLQEWEGYVTEVAEMEFSANLVDKTRGHNTEDEEATFAIEDVSDSDLELVRPGAIFRWSIGYLREREGTKRRISQLVFRRLPAWSSNDVQRSRAVAESFVASIVWE